AVLHDDGLIGGGGAGGGIDEAPGADDRGARRRRGLLRNEQGQHECGGELLHPRILAGDWKPETGNWQPATGNRPRRRVSQSPVSRILSALAPCDASA